MELNGKGNKVGGTIDIGYLEYMVAKMIFK